MRQQTLVLSVMILLAGRTWCSDRAVRGAITDEADNALPNALVETRCKGQSKTQVVSSGKTDERGAFVLRWDDAKACTVRVELAGFRPVELALRSAGATGALDIGTLRLKVGCSGPGVVCDSVTPSKAGDGKGQRK